MNKAAAGLLLLIFGCCVYFIPAIVAGARRVRHRGALFLINLLLGWTVLGWIGALLWSVIEKSESSGSEIVLVGRPTRGSGWSKPFYEP